MTPPEKINLLMIVIGLEGGDIFSQCILEDQPCARLGGCPLHEGWLGVRDQLVRFFEGSTLAQIAESRDRKNQASLGSKGTA